VTFKANSFKSKIPILRKNCKSNGRVFERLYNNERCKPYSLLSKYLISCNYLIITLGLVKSSSKRYMKKSPENPKSVQPMKRIKMVVPSEPYKCEIEYHDELEKLPQYMKEAY
jgi:hypothetical protein